MIKRNNRRGFTIVELVIVIAVIVVLAAVLIPTFAGIINKAKESADVQLVKQINDILYADAVVDGKHKTAHDAFTTLSDNGIDVTRLTPTSDGRLIVWDSANDRFVLVEEEDGDEVYPDDDQTPARISLFMASDTYDASKGYSIYLTDAFEGTSLSDVTTGVDVGSNPDVNSVTYTGSEEVIIRTNSENCSFSMSQGTVNHYGVALNAIVSGGTYNCFATLIDGQYASADEITDLFAGGQGTEESPYLVATEEQLKNLEEFSKVETYFKLVDDITFVTNEDEDGPYGYIYTYFQGVLDGDGHSIINANTDTSAPCLFYMTPRTGSATIKNLNYVVSGVVKPLFYMNESGYNCDEYSLTIENVTVKGAEDKIYDLCGYGTSPFVGINNGAVYFKNCVNELSYTIPSSGYAGIFIGNYGNSYTFASFENCVNKGTINGIYPGFFTGNETREVQLVNSNTQPTFNFKGMSCYISNCSNEGVLIGSQAVGAFGCNWPDKETTNDTCDATLTSAQFNRGTMIVGNITVGLTFNGNSISVDAASNVSIDKYGVSFESYMDCVDLGNSRFTYVEYLTAEEVASGKTLSKVSAIISRAEHEAAGGSYDAENAPTSGLYKYNVIDNGDGTRTIVVDTSNSPSFESFGEIENSVSAYDVNGLRLGYKHYK